MIRYKIYSSIVGFIIGDAIGVPYEFSLRNNVSDMKKIEMKGYGSHNVPAGTWSDDTSMVLATLDSIAENNSINYEDMMKKFCDWYFHNKYTSDNYVFDIGNTTRKALENYRKCRTSAIDCGLSSERSNGNGSLMRILPLAFYFYHLNILENDRIEIINNVSSLTHANDISKMGCLLFIDYVTNILSGYDKYESYLKLKSKDYSEYYSKSVVNEYSRLLNDDIKILNVDEISSSGYVISTLEAVIWTVLNSNTYEEGILKAIRLGNDTDTIAALVGGILGLINGVDNIPDLWVSKLRNIELINSIITKFSQRIIENDQNNQRKHNMR